MGARAEVRAGRARGRLRLGPLVLRWDWPVPDHGPVLARCWTYALRPDLSRERFTGRVLRLPGCSAGLAVLRADRGRAPRVLIERGPPRAWDSRSRPTGRISS